LPVWLWAALSAGLPLALPFAARSLASASGEGALATFNYAWKLVELPLVLAIQLVAALAFPAVAAVLARDDAAATQEALRKAFALAWALACGATAALLVGSSAIANLLFGWGRMSPDALTLVAHWGSIGAWSLLPQALIAVSLTVLASRGRLKVVVTSHAAALAVLLSYRLWGNGQGAELMLLLDGLQGGLAVAVVWALGQEARQWLPLRAMMIPLACLAILATAALQMPAALGLWSGLCLAGIAGLVVVGATWWGSPDLRAALAR
jgi:putative peptidoglycan lipid II flippase